MQKVIHVQSGAACALLDQLPYADWVTVPSKSIPQLKCGVPLTVFIEWLPIMVPSAWAWEPLTCPSRHARVKARLPGAWFICMSAK